MATYLVTGATGGIGEAVYERLARAGHRLVLAARNPDGLEALRSSLPEPSGTAHLSVSLDMASVPEITRFDKTLTGLAVELDGAVPMPPRPHSASDPMPEPEVWRTLFETRVVSPDVV